MSQGPRLGTQDKASWGSAFISLDQLPSAPTTRKDCTHKIGTKMSPLTLKLFLCFIFAFYHNVQNNK